jgi:hypothetical protein
LEDKTVAPTGLGTQTHLVYAVVIDQGQLYTDLTVIFPVRSSKGNWYVMVFYSYDCNYVNSVPIKSISTSEWLKAYSGIFQELTPKGFTPTLQTLDNEASTVLKSYFTEIDVEYQLVPPHCHRRNTTERAIHTFKEHVVTCPPSAEPYFPLHVWDLLLPQAEITLNLLRTPRQHPHLSAAAHSHGMIDINKTALLKFIMCRCRPCMCALSAVECITTYTLKEWRYVGSRKWRRTRNMTNM